MKSILLEIDKEAIKLLDKIITLKICSENFFLIATLTKKTISENHVVSERCKGIQFFL